MPEICRFFGIIIRMFFDELRSDWELALAGKEIKKIAPLE
jgi:hypothetical protein